MSNDRENAFIVYARKARARIVAAPDGMPKVMAILDVMDELAKEDPAVVAKDAEALKYELRQELDRQVEKVKAVPLRAMWLLKKLFR
jgi:hypothetical protein